MTSSASVETPVTPMVVQTPFGEREVRPQDCVAFPEGLPGFEQCRQFVLLSSPDAAPVQCLHAIDGPAASFLAVDPRVVLKGYRCALADQDRRRLGVDDDSALVWLALITVDEGDAPSVNLRAPVVVNPTRMIGFQLMPHNSLYPLRHPLEAD